jgi:uncharacterized protein YbjQ (UPF0145 family)
MAQWKVRIGEEEFPARDRQMVIDWIVEGRLRADSAIYDPALRDWVSYADFADQLAAGIMITTTPSFEGQHIVRYIDVECGEQTEHAILGAAQTPGALARVRATAVHRLRIRAALRGGNAVVGLDVNYLAFDLGVAAIASGTVVVIEPSAAPQRPQ